VRHELRLAEMAETLPQFEADLPEEASRRPSGLQLVLAHQEIEIRPIDTRDGNCLSSAAMYCRSKSSMKDCLGEEEEEPSEPTDGARWG